MNETGSLHEKQSMVIRFVKQILLGKSEKNITNFHSYVMAYNIPHVLYYIVLHSGGFRVGGARGKTKQGGPLMTSSCSANRDLHFLSSIR